MAQWWLAGARPWLAVAQLNSSPQSANGGLGRCGSVPFGHRTWFSDHGLSHHR